MLGPFRRFGFKPRWISRSSSISSAHMVGPPSLSSLARMLSSSGRITVDSALNSSESFVHCHRNWRRQRLVEAFPAQTGRLRDFRHAAHGHVTKRLEQHAGVFIAGSQRKKFRDRFLTFEIVGNLEWCVSDLPSDFRFFHRSAYVARPQDIATRNPVVLRRTGNTMRHVTEGRICLCLYVPVVGTRASA
jgi:hypothetical protein